MEVQRTYDWIPTVIHDFYLEPLPWSGDGRHLHSHPWMRWFCSGPVSLVFGTQIWRQPMLDGVSFFARRKTGQHLYWLCCTAPKWYSQYRFYLSILVGTCIICSLAATSYWGPVGGHGFLSHELDMVRLCTFFNIRKSLICSRSCRFVLTEGRDTLQIVVS